MKYEKTKAVLNQLVADLSQLAMVVHQTHWYMRGTNFLKLHPLMDDWWRYLRVLSESTYVVKVYSTVTIVSIDSSGDTSSAGKNKNPTAVIAGDCSTPTRSG